MKKLLIIAIVFVCGLLNAAEAQLPGNPLNPHGTLFDRPGLALARWERDGTNLYWEFEITTPATFYLPSGTYPWYESYIEFVAYKDNYNDPSSYRVPYPGSMSFNFDAYNYPYGYRYYSGIIDLTDYDDYWTNIQADFSFYIDNNDGVSSDSNFITYEELYP